LNSCPISNIFPEITGDRTRHVLTFNPNSDKPGEEIYVNIPKLKADSALVPDSIALVFDFKNSNTKSWFRNNLGKLLQTRLEIRLAGEKVYDNIVGGLQGPMVTQETA
jgi:hypothetical protein